MVDGAPIVLRDVDAWLREEAVSLLRRADLPGPTWERIVQGAGGPLQRDQRLLEVYAASQDGPLQRWTRERVGSLDGLGLDLGSGSASYGQPASGSVVGMDLNWSLLARFPGRRLLADAHDPPFLPESFDAVLLLNLLDSCREPFLVLQQADALLKPGGRLLLSCAFAWQDEITPPASRLEERFLLGFLQLRGYTLEPQGLLELDWPLQIGPRTRHVHRALALDARKPPPATRAAPPP